jgi:hypothetical protein
VVRKSVVALALATVSTWSAPAAAKRDKPIQVGPPKRAKAPKDADLSKGGTERGGLEFALGSIAAVLSGVLIGRGTWELVKADELEKDCAASDSDNPECTGVFGSRPWRTARIAGGISIGLSVPMAIASGFLLRRGVRVHRAWTKWHAQERAVALHPWAGRDGGGLRLMLRF